MAGAKAKGSMSPTQAHAPATPVSCVMADLFRNVQAAPDQPRSAKSAHLKCLRSRADAVATNRPFLHENYLNSQYV